MKRAYIWGLLAALPVLAGLAVVLLPGAIAAGNSSYTLAVVSTTDMHGCSTLRDVAAQEENLSSMARAATSIPTQRQKYVARMGSLSPNDQVSHDFDSTGYLDTEDNPLPFADVRKNAWYAEAVRFAVESGMMNGMGGGIFQPEGRSTRAQIATLTHRLCGLMTLPDLLTEPFLDVRQTDWFYPGVLFAYHSDIIRGQTETIFAPNAGATRQDMITMLYRMVVSAELKAEIKGDLSPFTDGSQVAPYARDAMAWAVGEGLIVGFANAEGEMEIQPTGTTTRAQLATIIMRFMSLEFEVAP